MVKVSQAEAGMTAAWWAVECSEGGPVSLSPFQKRHHAALARAARGRPLACVLEEDRASDGNGVATVQVPSVFQHKHP